MADATPKPKPKDYDERIYRKGHPPHRIRNALILIGLVLVGTYLAVTKELPFGDKYEVKAVFENAANIRKDSPVRIAGVNVGKVQSVRSVGDAAEVTFTVDEEGQPIREDSLVEIRPRIFLEGNFFLDVKPGSPSAPEVPDGGTIPITQTATAVQLDQILTTLQAPDRENLSKLLVGYGQALNSQPTAADDKGADPDIQGETAGQAINDSFQYGGPAGRDSAIVNEALLGTEPGDLSGLIASNAKVFNALLSREEQLKDLITNFNTFAGALASESDNLSETVRLLAPTLENATPSLRNTNATFPYLRAFARDIEPGIAELPATIAASQPWIKQTRKLLDRSELGRLAYQLRLTGQPAGTLAAAAPGLFSETELLSRCTSNVLIPTGDVPILDVFTAPPTSRGGQRAELQGVRLRAHRLHRRVPGLRRQRLLHPLPDGGRKLRGEQRAGRHAGPGHPGPHGSGRLRARAIGPDRNPAGAGPEAAFPHRRRLPDESGP